MICRICLEKTESPLEIFSTNGEQLNIANILEQHFWFKPSPTDCISVIICRLCWLKVNEFHQFYVTVEKAHTKLHEQKVKGEFFDTVVQQELPVEVFARAQQLDIEVKEEFVGNVWQEFENEEDTTLIGLENPLRDVDIVESTRFTKSDDTTSDSINFKAAHNNAAEEADKKPTRCKNISKKRAGKRKSLVTKDDSDNDFEEIEWQPEKSDNILKKRTRKRKLIAATTASDSLKKTRKPFQTFPSSERDDELIKKHISMGCDLCTFVGQDFPHMRAHFREKHEALKPYIVCCDRKLNKRALIVQHAYKHEDPEYFKCKVCQRVLTNAYYLRAHMLTSHAPEEDLKYKCDQCEKRFVKASHLELHKPTHIPMHERKYFCNKCPQAKAFASEYLLQIHVSMRHTKATNVCHVCAKEIRDKQSFDKHVRLHFEDSGPRVKCPRADCDCWLKDKDSLKKHLQRHDRLNEGKTFHCEQCSKVFKSRSSLYGHQNYAHSNEIFSCELCQKTFKRALTLKEHMASHTGESLYNCPFCTRTFNSNANMHSHKKKMHPVEWDIWRKTKGQQVTTVAQL